MAQEMDKLSRILKRKRRRRAMMFAFISVVLVVAALVLLNIFCVVDVIKVNNETEYDTGEVLAKAGIFTGNQMLTMNPNDLESVIEKGFPYIDSAKVEIILPKTVSLSLISTIPYMALDQADGTYIYVDKSFKILECSEEKASKRRFYQVSSYVVYRECDCRTADK